MPEIRIILAIHFYWAGSNLLSPTYIICVTFLKLKTSYESKHCIRSGKYLYILACHGTGKTLDLDGHFFRQGKHSKFPKIVLKYFIEGIDFQHRDNFEVLKTKEYTRIWVEYIFGIRMKFLLQALLHFGSWFRVFIGYLSICSSSRINVTLHRKNVKNREFCLDGGMATLWFRFLKLNWEDLKV